MDCVTRVGGPKKVEVLNLEEIACILAELPAEHRLFFEFVLSTGLRWSEAIAVQRGDIDAAAGTVRIERSADPGREVQATKSLHSIREVRLSEGLLEELLEGAGEDPEALLFKDPDGKRAESQGGPGIPRTQQRRVHALDLYPPAQRLGEAGD